jgi:hypothetical protein
VTWAPAQASAAYGGRLGAAAAALHVDGVSARQRWPCAPAGASGVGWPVKDEAGPLLCVSCPQRAGRCHGDVAWSLAWHQGGAMAAGQVA